MEGWELLAEQVVPWFARQRPPVPLIGFNVDVVRCETMMSTLVEAEVPSGACELTPMVPPGAVDSVRRRSEVETPVAAVT